MNRVLLLLMVWFCACSPENTEIFDLSSSVDDIKLIKLRADHKMLLPDGIAQMEFHVLAYGAQEFTTYEIEEVEGQDQYVIGTSRDTFEIPLDRLPEGCIKVYDDAGREVKDMIYSTTDRNKREITFYAKAGNVQSNSLTIQIRDLPEMDYEEIVVPVIFHVMVPPPSIGPAYSVSSEELQKRLDHLNDIFNRRATSDPNGGNAKIIFKLAEYDPSGRLLLEKGKNKVELAEEMSKSDYEDYINSKLIWDPARYLNVWLAKYSTSSSVSNTYSVSAPEVILEGYESIPGLKMQVVSDYSASDVENYTDVGMMINIRDFFATDGKSYFDLSLVFGLYYGLLYTDQDDNNTFVNGDNDYCPDTYSFDYGFYPSVFKANNLDGQPENDPTRPLEYFTSFNVMDMYSYKNSLSVDQVKRLRMVLQQCPSRWAYKSDWAFTGGN